MLISLSQLSSCSDPLDKIYAIYGLLPDNFQRLPAVDYSRDKSKLYEDFTRATIELTEKFWPASLRWRTEPVFDLPSWVPDVSHRKKTATSKLFTAKFFDTLESMKMMATLQSKVNLRTLQTSKPGTIALKGRAYTTIIQFDKRWPKWEESRWQLFLCLVHWIVFCLSAEGLDNPYDSQGGRLPALGELLMVDFPDEPGRIAPKQFASIVTWIDKMPRSDPSQADDSNADHRWRQQVHADKDVRDFVGCTTYYLAESILFRTATGHLGRTVAHIEQGDTIALLAGSDWPVILRQQDDIWRFIGPAYITGIMSGEAWPPDTNTDELETFILI
jgi:hypothetical protein